MNGGNRVVAIDPGSLEAAGDEFLLTEEVAAPVLELEQWVAEEAAEVPASRPESLAVPMLALAAAAGWTGLFAWSKATTAIAGAPLEQWVGWIGEWAVPIALICVVWLLAMRNSKRETARFGDAARLLSDESSRLEARLNAVNSELSLAREFIAAQARDLDSLGRVATERLTQSADRLQSLIQANSAQIDSIGSVSEAALDNMEKLRGQLPVIANSARDVTNNIGNAGRTAHAQLQEMINGFKRLNEFGQASERQVESMRELVGATLEELNAQTSQLEETAERRFASIVEKGGEFRSQLESCETEALAALRVRSEALAGEFERSRGKLDAQEAQSLASLASRMEALRGEWEASAGKFDTQEEERLNALANRMEAMRVECEMVADKLDAQETERLAALTGRMEALRVESEDMSGKIRVSETAALESFRHHLGQFDEAIAARQQRLQDNAQVLAGHGEAIARQMSGLEQRIDEAAEHANEAEIKLGQSVQDLAARLVAGRAALNGADSEISALTEASVRLLELIQAGSQHSREAIPAALAEAEANLETIENRVRSLQGAAGEIAGMGQALEKQMQNSHAGISATSIQLEALHDRLGERSGAHGETLERLRQSLEAIEVRSDNLSARAQAELTAAIGELTQSAESAVSGIESNSAAAIARIAQRLGEESKSVIDRIVEERTAEFGGQLEQGAARAAEVSRAAAIQMRDQLSAVNELAGNLERRVAHARERAEEQIDNDFSRRVALITEALNSNSIDIARAIDSEVSDTAWASYLKGDRGIFTRRAVSLIESGEARSIVQVYESDKGFREQVNRYIHDFEAMLRQILSTRDGNALGVTLLSSDMGKLYVALAQAIERLRS